LDEFLTVQLEGRFRRVESGIECARNLIGKNDVLTENGERGMNPKGR